MGNKIDFWFESNAWFGRIDKLVTLADAMKHLIDENNIFTDVDEFLDRSKQSIHDELDFGTRIEHQGPKTLREYLIEINELDNFLELLK